MNQCFFLLSQIIVIIARNMEIVNEKSFCLCIKPLASCKIWNKKSVMVLVGLFTNRSFIWGFFGWLVGFCLVLCGFLFVWLLLFVCLLFKKILSKIFHTLKHLPWREKIPKWNFSMNFQEEHGCRSFIFDIKWRGFIPFHFGSSLNMYSYSFQKRTW